MVKRSEGFEEVGEEIMCDGFTVGEIKGEAL